MTNSMKLMEDKLRIILSAEGERILKKLNSYASPGGVTNTILTCWWSGEMRWGRNRISMATERRDVSLEIFRQIGRGEGSVTTNQLDDESLKCSLQAAERAARYMESRQRDFPIPRTEVPQQPIPTPKIWSDATANIGAEQRTELARILTNDSEDAGLMAAGYLEISLAARLMILSNRELRKSDPMWPRDYRYDCWSGGGCSMTVRHPKGVGSGWAGQTSYDWSNVNAPALASRALEKCRASLNPVAIEPGRYTVILEPQAVSDLVCNLFFPPPGFSRDMPEHPDYSSPYKLGPDPAIQRIRSKLGLRIVDERITLSQDVMDPLQGDVPEPDARKVVFIDKGVLVSLAHSRSYALVNGFGDRTFGISGAGFHMSGGMTSMDEMIQTTKRGLIVTRFSNIGSLDPENSVLCGGLTRDGLWLVEDGRISKAVKNMRFTESPLFMLNQIEQLGVPQPVLLRGGIGIKLGLSPVIVPPIKARDFSFTAMIDAI